MTAPASAHLLDWDRGRLNSRNQSVSAFREVLCQIRCKFLGSGNERTVVLVAQEIVENALPPNSGGRSIDVKVLVEQVNIRPGRKIGHVESGLRQQFVQISGTAGEDPVRLAFDPPFEIDLPDVCEGCLVDAEIDGLVSESEAKLPRNSIRWLGMRKIITVLPFRGLSAGVYIVQSRPIRLGLL